jgi:uncharacterized membrane protein
MVLITCPDCHRSVSHRASSCPGCGRPLQAPSWAPPLPAQRFEAEKQNLQLAYGLYAGSFIVGLLAIASVILCYMRRREARGTAAAAHYDWLIDTFWTHMIGVVGGLLFVLVLVWIEGFVLAYLTILALVLFALGYPIYRLVVGFMALRAGKGPVEGGRSLW